MRAGDYGALGGCRVVVICAGVGQKPGETRLQLLQRNAQIFDEVARIVRGTLYDERAIATVCTPTSEVAGVHDVTLSLPRLVGGSGVLETFPMPLSDEENDQLRESALVIKTALDQLGEGEGERRAHAH